MSTDFYVLEKQFKHARSCDVCNEGMSEGYLDENSGETYCSYECLSKNNLQLEQLDYEISIGAIFWTDWHGGVGYVE